jgi:hypothetical protein
MPVIEPAPSVASNGKALRVAIAGIHTNDPFYVSTHREEGWIKLTPQAAAADPLHMARSSLTISVDHLESKPVKKGPLELVPAGPPPTVSPSPASSPEATAEEEAPFGFGSMYVFEPSILEADFAVFGVPLSVVTFARVMAGPNGPTVSLLDPAEFQPLPEGAGFSVTGIQSEYLGQPVLWVEVATASGSLIGSAEFSQDVGGKLGFVNDPATPAVSQESGYGAEAPLAPALAVGGVLVFAAGGWYARKRFGRNG